MEIATNVCAPQKYAVGTETGSGLGTGLSQASSEGYTEQPCQQLKNLCFPTRAQV